jgi:hypothetical protein
VSDYLAMHVVRAVACACVGIVGPALGMWLFGRTIREHASRVENYRGIAVPVTLWVAWLMWGLGLAVVFAVGDLTFRFERIHELQTFSIPLLNAAVAPMRAVLPALVLGTVLVGLVDDVLGSGEARGFAGHVRALREGRVTTGLFKLIGIGMLSIAAAAALVRSFPPWTDKGALETVLGLILAATVIASSANLANLLDARPGRLVKVHVLASAVLALSIAAGGGGIWALWTAYEGSFVFGRTLNAIAMFALWAGPMLVVARADHAEAGMLGDAGSNPAGALLGLALAGMLDFVGLAVAAVALVALNLLSEKVSFSVAIERHSVLRRLDGLGRKRTASDETPDIPDER